MERSMEDTLICHVIKIISYAKWKRNRLSNRATPVFALTSSYWMLSG